jgi:uncharacterized membrane protein
MVAVEQDAAVGGQVIVLRPNIALRWRQTLLVYGFMAFTCLGVAIGFAAMGFWPVLPFAGLEVALLGWALNVSAHRALERELIIIRDGRVEIRQGRRRPEQCWVFESYWTRVACEPPEHRWYPNRLLLRCRGQQVEVGRFLRNDERLELARKLKSWVGPITASGDAPERRMDSQCGDSVG